MGDYRAKLAKEELRGKYGRILMKKYFLIKDKFFNVVFYADSEYHVYFARKLTFDSQNLEIRMQFLTFGRQVRND